MSDLQAIISDVHGNFEAMKAVLDDILSKNITDIVCLGDLIGYGPNPKECIDFATNFRITMIGNHEEALMEELRTSGFNPKASGSRNWTYEQLNLFDEEHKDENAKRWDFIGEMEETRTEDDIMYVHASPCDPTREYIYQRDIAQPVKMKRIFAEIEHICFLGHTHQPGVFTEDLKYYSPRDLPKVCKLPQSKKSIVNVGSVGQPRDFDVRACYVVLDPKARAIAYRRVSYDVQCTAQKIFETDGLDDTLGQRLLAGR
ncbi:MAG: metallophosphoesterase [Planctomycetes bacterium]|nr:metallophosphoesterase [Planctomycetota bacterium]